MTNTDERYNGWTNRETWAVHLHLSNDKGLYNESRERAQKAARSFEDPREGVGFAADALKDWVTDELLSPDYWTDDMGMPMPRDLENMRIDAGSLWRVDWYEVAEAFLED